jgi:hypothetical protein
MTPNNCKTPHPFVKVMWGLNRENLQNKLIWTLGYPAFSVFQELKRAYHACRPEKMNAG